MQNNKKTPIEEVKNRLFLGHKAHSSPQHSAPQCLPIIFLKGNAPVIVLGSNERLIERSRNEKIAVTLAASSITAIVCTSIAYPFRILTLHSQSSDKPFRTIAAEQFPKSQFPTLRKMFVAFWHNFRVSGFDKLAFIAPPYIAMSLTEEIQDDAVVDVCGFSIKGRYAKFLAYSAGIGVTTLLQPPVSYVYRMNQIAKANSHQSSGNTQTDYFSKKALVQKYWLFQKYMFSANYSTYYITDIAEAILRKAAPGWCALHPDLVRTVASFTGLPFLQKMLYKADTRTTQKMNPHNPVTVEKAPDKVILRYRILWKTLENAPIKIVTPIVMVSLYQVIDALRSEQKRQEKYRVEKNGSQSLYGFFPSISKNKTIEHNSQEQSIARPKQ